jgi:ketosteroid isomerase-like protein
MIRRPASLLSAVLAFAGSGCRQPPPATGSEQVRQEIMEAERGFAAAVARQGVDAWVATFDSNGAEITPRGVIRGSAAIRAHMTPQLADTSVLLSWEPDTADVAASADLGYAIGHWKITPRARPDSVLAHGNYVTIWKRQANGEWKAVVDIGNQEK